ncbi:MAG: methionyl-tRNA formyltransferase [Chloroflexota bacterium]
MASVVFMGTPDFAVPTLQALIDHHDVIGVVTQPDRPAGRGGKVRQSPIKELALQHAIPVFQPKRLRKQEAIDELAQWKHADVFVVAAFGQILPEAVLEMPKHGSINVHASLLPRWRGAAPIHAAIRAGDAQTGVTIMVMDVGLDTGPMLSTVVTPIASDETGQSLHDRLAQLGADLLVNTLPGYLDGSITPQEQPEGGVTYAGQIDKQEGNIDWTQGAATIERLVRAFTPWPGTFTQWNDTQLKIHAGTVGDGSLAAGEVALVNEQVAIGTGEGVFLPTEVQLAGKKRTDIDDFVNGYQDFVGSSLPS